MNLSDAKKSRALEDENNRPKRMLADLYRSVFQYEQQNGGDGALRKRLRELANGRRGFGYRRLHILLILHILLQREGVEVTHKKLFRLYREEPLTVGKRGGRKRVLGRRRPIPVPDRANRRRSLNLVVGLRV